VKDNATGVVWVLTNKQIEAGAKAIAEDMMLPGGGRKKLSRVVENHLDWFDAVEARGLTWGNISRLLLAAGAKGRNGRAISIGTLSSTVWRKRKETQALANPARRPTKTRITPERSGLRGQTGDQHAPPSRAVAHQGSKKPTQGRTSSGPTSHVTRNAAKAHTPPNTEAASKAQTLAFMKRAATIRRARTE